MLVLERRFSWSEGVRMRLRRLEPRSRDAGRASPRAKC